MKFSGDLAKFGLASLIMLQTGDNQIPESFMAQFTDAYAHY